MKILDIPRSGSVAGETSSRNRGGQYVRTRAIPTQPRTALQQQAKERFSNGSIAWRALTDEQRAGWNAFAQSFTVLNSLGQAIHLTGHQAFVKVFSVEILLGNSAPTDPPALPTFGANPCTALNVAYGTAEFSLTCGTIPAETSIMVYATAPQSVGRSYAANWRYLKSFTTATAGKITVTTEYEAKFGAMQADKKYFALAVQEMAGMQDVGAVFSKVPTA